VLDTDIQDVDPDVDPDTGDIYPDTGDVYPDIDQDTGGINPYVNPSADIYRNTSKFIYIYVYGYKPY
jgi:hypothetical protein